MTETRPTFQDLTNALSSGQFHVADKMPDNLALPADPETLCKDRDRENVVDEIFETFPPSARVSDPTYSTGREYVLTAILDSFGDPGAGWSRGLVEWLEKRFSPADFATFGRDRPFMVDRSSLWRDRPDAKRSTN